jgi:hypothetical protein
MKFSFDDFPNLAIKVSLLCLAFMLLYVVPLNIYAHNNIDRHDLSTWQLECEGIFTKSIDEFGRTSYYISNEELPINIRWSRLADANGARVDYQYLIDGKQYKFYSKSFWWPMHKFYLITTY